MPRLPFLSHPQSFSPSSRIPPVKPQSSLPLPPSVHPVNHTSTPTTHLGDPRLQVECLDCGWVPHQGALQGALAKQGLGRAVWRVAALTQAARYAQDALADLLLGWLFETVMCVCVRVCWGCGRVEGRVSVLQFVVSDAGLIHPLTQHTHTTRRLRDTHNPDNT